MQRRKFIAKLCLPAVYKEYNYFDSEKKTPPLKYNEKARIINFRMNIYVYFFIEISSNGKHFYIIFLVPNYFKLLFEPKL